MTQSEYPVANIIFSHSLGRILIVYIIYRCLMSDREPSKLLRLKTKTCDLTIYRGFSVLCSVQEIQRSWRQLAYWIHFLSLILVMRFSSSRDMVF
jgi:hypothetical protein